MGLMSSFDFRSITGNIDPASPPNGWLLGAGSGTSRYLNRGEGGWESTSTQALWYNTTIMQGNTVETAVTAGLLVGASIGAAIVDINGNGYMVINSSAGSSLRLFEVRASQLFGTALLTLNLPMVTGQNIKLRRTILPNNNYEILINDVSQGSYNAPATYDPKYGACVSRYGSVRKVDLYYIPNQTVDTINGGSPFTASQTSSSAETTGFTGGGSMSSITATWGAYSLPITNIGGTLDDPTFDKSVRVDGQVYPKNGETLNFTFTKGTETASKTCIANKDADEVELIAAAPVIEDPKYLFGAIFAATGRTAVTGDYGYYKVPSGMSDLTIAQDGRIQTTNAGTFQYWSYTAATAVNYYYSVTVSAGGEVVNSGLTSSTYKVVARRI